MVSDLKKLVEETLEMDKKATPGSWVSEQNNNFFDGDEPRRPNVIQSGDTAVAVTTWGCDCCQPKSTEQTAANAKAIAHYRTSAPRLARIVKVMEEALRNIVENDKCATQDGEILDGFEGEKAKRALAEAERIAGES